jgi:hypothetical protein
MALVISGSSPVLGSGVPLTEIPEKPLHPPFPATLGYAVWSLTTVPCALIAVRNISYTRSGIVLALF